MPTEHTKPLLTPAETAELYASMEALWKEAAKRYNETGVPTAESILRSMYPDPEILWHPEESKLLLSA